MLILTLYLQSILVEWSELAKQWRGNESNLFTRLSTVDETDID